MSRSNQTEVVNPAKRFIEWKGSKGIFSYYDKEKEENVEMPLPFTFIVLDTLSTIKGYSDSAGSGFWSNEVRNTTKDKMTLRNKDGVVAEGLYQEIKGHRDATGAKYSQSVYIAYFEGKDLVIGNIQIMGAALNAWIDFRGGNDIMKGAVTVKDKVEGKKGATVYQIPVFEMKELSAETEAKAIELDKELQSYLSEYLGGSYTKEQEDAMHGEEEEKKLAAVEPKSLIDDGLPF